MTDEELEALREWVRAHEGIDDWNVPYVYTRRLRELLKMEASPR